MKHILISTLLFSTFAFANNGGNLIGVGPRSLGMGGTGVAHYNGIIDGIYKNPSLLIENNKPGKWAAEYSSSYIGLSVTANSGASGDVESLAKGTFIPDLAASYQFDDSMAFALGILPYTGAKFDFTNSPATTALTGLQVDHKVTRIQPTFTMSPVKGFAFGVAPIVAYGELALNSAITGTQSTTPPHGGVGVGGQIGASYKVNDLLIGASFITPVKIKYKEVSNIEYFGGNSGSPGGEDDLEIQQPMELGFGVGYQVMPEWSVTVDYRNIGWSKANIYQQLGWKSQNVIAIGTEYKINAFAIRAGFNYAKSPVEDIAGEDGIATVTLDGHDMYAGSASKLNAIAFPPAATTHFTVGGGYEFSQDFGADLAFMFVPEATITRSGTLGTAYTHTSKTKAWSVGAGIRWNVN